MSRHGMTSYSTLARYSLLEAMPFARFCGSWRPVPRPGRQHCMAEGFPKQSSCVDRRERQMQCNGISLPILRSSISMDTGGRRWGGEGGES